MFGFQDDSEYGRARDVLQAANFTEKAIGSLIGREQILTMPPSDVPSVLRRTRELSRLDTLTRLFFLGLPVPLHAARSALAPMPLDSWVQATLLLPPDSEGMVAPRVQIWPVCDLFLAVDLPWRRSTAPEADFVVPPGPLTLQLVHAMIRRPCMRMLDLGTGSGLLALLAAPFTETVTASDRNPRALAFTQFNARLNLIPNVRCLAGDLFEPVGQERFQLIICNPPFVISPTQRFVFRDSGERGDAFCRRLVRAGVDHLESGGFFQLFANIAHQAGGSWRSDLEEWFDGLGADVLVLVQATESASDYAMSWILSTESKERAVVAQHYEVWMDYFERERIDAVSYLLITLRPSTGGRNWVQIDDPPCQIVGPCGDELLLFFESRDRFGDPQSIEQLLDRSLKLDPAIRLEQEYFMAPSGLELQHVRLKKTGGLRYPLETHSNVARLLAGCDGSRTLRRLLEEMAGSLGVGWDQLVAVVLPVIQSLMERGVLLPADRSGLA